MRHYDLIVIGSGPAGQSAAIGARKNKLSVLIIEDKNKVGGNCTFNGTIPSKSLRECISKYKLVKTDPILSSLISNRLSIKHISKYAKQVVNKQNLRISDNFSRNEVAVITGKAKFINNTTIEVSNGINIKQFQGTNFVIATGSRPYRPIDIDFSHPMIFDSTTILSLNKNITSLAIIGGGIIANEYACIFAGLGVAVTIFNPRNSLMEFLDDDISSCLQKQLEAENIQVLNGQSVSSIVPTKEGNITVITKNIMTDYDAVLFANGRTGNSDSLNLQCLNIKTNSRGQIPVNKNYRTEADNIYAAGDIIGHPSLASTSFEQGRIVSEIISGNNPKISSQLYPTGIYTIPEISFIGLNEKELQNQNIQYLAGNAHFSHLARSQISGCEVGFIKILFCPKTLKIFGVHCFGSQASEIIHVGQSIMLQNDGGNTIEYFVNTMFNYPTNAEAYRVAALNGINKLTN
jgi:NAD(P) transhydrogenase